MKYYEDEENHCKRKLTLKNLVLLLLFSFPDKFYQSPFCFLKLDQAEKKTEAFSEVKILKEIFSNCNE